MHAPMPQYFVLQDQRVIERVPRPPHLSPPCDSIPAVIFYTNGWAGARVVDLLTGKVVVNAANDAVLEEHGFRSITISLEVWAVAPSLCPLFLKQPHSGQAIPP